MEVLFPNDLINQRFTAKTMSSLTENFRLNPVSIIVNVILFAISVVAWDYVDIILG